MALCIFVCISWFVTLVMYMCICNMYCRMLVYTYMYMCGHALCTGHFSRPLKPVYTLNLYLYIQYPEGHIYNVYQLEGLGMHIVYTYIRLLVTRNPLIRTPWNEDISISRTHLAAPNTLFAYITTPENQDTSLIRTRSSVASVSGLERFHCVFYNINVYLRVHSST